MRSFIVVLATAALCLFVDAVYAAAPVHQFVHFTVYISATTGEQVRYETEAPMAGEKCLKILEGMGGRQVKNGLAEVHFCRAVDAQGAPVPEIKVNPETLQPLDDNGKAPVVKEEAPKVST
jgi:hypothetical protein